MLLPVRVMQSHEQQNPGSQSRYRTPTLGSLSRKLHAFWLWSTLWIVLISVVPCSPTTVPGPAGHSLIEGMVFWAQKSTPNIKRHSSLQVQSPQWEVGETREKQQGGGDHRETYCCMSLITNCRMILLYGSHKISLGVLQPILALRKQFLMSKWLLN